MRRKSLQLTALERQTIQLIADGQSYKEIATRHGVSLQAIKVRIDSICSRYNISSDGKRYSRKTLMVMIGIQRGDAVL